LAASGRASVPAIELLLLGGVPKSLQVVLKVRFFQEIGSMKSRLLAALWVAGVCGAAAPMSWGQVSYPQTRAVEQVDDYFGTKVADPYRWMEDLDSPALKEWVEAQNQLTMPYLKEISGRDAIEKRLTELWNYERYGTPFKEGGRYFYSYNPGLQNHNIIYVAEALNAPPRLLLDPNTFSEDGKISLAGLHVSPNARVAAYAKSDGGTDWRDWFFMDVETGAQLPDHLTFTKFSGMSWARDSSGVYYSRYPVGENGRGDDTKQVAIYFHKLGTPQSADRLIYDLYGAPQHRGLDPNPYASATEDGRYLVIGASAGYHENLVGYIDLQDPDGKYRPLISEWTALYSYIGNEGPVFYFKTTDDAPSSRVIAINIHQPERENWTVVIPEAAEPLRNANYIGRHIVAQYLKDARSLVKIFDGDGDLVREVKLPDIGSAGGFGGRGDDSETFYSFSGFTTPSESYRYNVITGESELFKRPTVAGLNPDAYETRQVFYTSKDGTKVPMFIISRKGIDLDGSHPTLLYGYGGFNVSLTPGYSSSRMVWVEMGGILAIPNIRGGGEYGKNWHLAGTKENKQNVFDDFIAAAEWLIDNKYTTSKKLAIQGGSNGGLLVGACITQRPELFGAAIPSVGVLDMLRYHLPSANARNWSTDYGLSENREDFESQIRYSPLHNVKQGACYPPTLITTADHDDRVVPWHSFKFAAALQAAQACDNPVLIRVETRAGHGAGKPTWMIIEEVADSWAFLARHLGMTIPQVSPDSR
jgi:prolyl oligopeptidase